MSSTIVQVVPAVPGWVAVYKDEKTKKVDHQPVILWALIYDDEEEDGQFVTGMTAREFVEFCEDDSFQGYEWQG